MYTSKERFDEANENDWKIAKNDPDWFKRARAVFRIQQREEARKPRRKPKINVRNFVHNF